ENILPGRLSGLNNDSHRVSVEDSRQFPSVFSIAGIGYSDPLRRGGRQARDSTDRSPASGAPWTSIFPFSLRYATLRVTPPGSGLRWCGVQPTHSCSRAHSWREIYRPRRWFLKV